MYIYRLIHRLEMCPFFMSNQHHKHSRCVANFAHFLQAKQMMPEASRERPPAIESLFSLHFYVCFLIRCLMLMSLTLNSHPSKTTHSVIMLYICLCGTNARCSSSPYMLCKVCENAQKWLLHSRGVITSWHFRGGYTCGEVCHISTQGAWSNL